MDLITYIPKLSAMRIEAVSMQGDEENQLAPYFTIDDDGGVSFDVNKIPVTKTKDGQSICLVRGISRKVIESSKTIEVLGECIDNQYVFDSVKKQNIYESIYDTKPRMIDDGDGGQVEYTPPYMMGVFA